MPVQFLSTADHARLNAGPDDIPPTDLDAYFQLNTEDVAVLSKLRGDANRLGFALQLCCLRYLGFFPHTLNESAEVIVGYVAEQLTLQPNVLADYAVREPTLFTHQQRILTHLNFRRATPMDLITLDAWLLERALEHDRPKVVFSAACDYLRRERIVRPGTTRLEQLVGHARNEAQRVAFERLQAFMTPARRSFLDSLLDVGATGTTKLVWLQRTPTSNKTRAIVETLDKIAFLQDNGVGNWDLSALTPNRRKWLARKASRARADNLGNQQDQTRLPQLAAFAKASLLEFTDVLLDMFDARLWELHGECRLAFRNDRLAATKAINETMAVLQKLGSLFLGVADTDAAPSEEDVRWALSNAQHLTRPENDAYTDYFAARHRKVQNFSKRLLEVMTFHSSTGDAGLPEGLQIIADIHAGVRRKLPAGAPTSFIPPIWEPEVFGDEGLNWRSYEIAALWVLREKLRSGDIYVKQSRRYLQLAKYLIPKTKWGGERKDVAGLLGAPLTAEPRLAERTRVFEQLVANVENLLTDSDALRREDGRLIVSPLQADEDPPSLTLLRKLIDERLPRVDITALLIEVDNLVGFSRAFHHLDGVTTRGKSLLTQLYACILAQACNLGFKQMSVSADLAFRGLLWCNRWYLRNETLEDAVTRLVNYHHALPLSLVWGSGTLSSSDGQRFLVRGDTRKARAQPRYFGYGKGVTSYSWTSDQLTQFGSKIIPSTVRDATYVLDAILDNETDLLLGEHTTDTAGYTELMFGLFGLLGLTFSPRIKDLADQQLYRPESFDVTRLGLLRPQLGKVLNETRITQGWDEMLRAATSLKKGYCTASLLVTKLQAYPRQHPLTRAIQEYGRLEKTLHILRWYAEPATRKRISKQLNKGEALHALRRVIVFGQHGDIPGGEDEALDQQFACLNLVTNAIIVFNTVHIARIADELRLEGYEVRDEDLARVWPSRYAHINFLGKYVFDKNAMRNA